MKKLYLQRLLPGILATVLSLLTSASIHAQVGINSDNSAPDTSAMLDISSSDKGILIPRMDSISRTAILQPADGLMVYDTTTTTFWYYDEERWNEIRNGETKLNALDLAESLPEPDFSCTEIIAQLNIPGIIQSISLVDNYLYVLGGNVLNAINLSDPNNPTIEGTFSAGRLENMIAIPGYVFLVQNGFGSSNGRGFLVVDVADPTNMVQVDDFGLSQNPVTLTYDNGFLYLSTFDEFTIYDFSNPANFNNDVGGSDSANGATDISVLGDYAYAVGNFDNAATGSLEILDVSNVFSFLPEVGSLSLGNAPVGVAVSGNYAYVIDDDSNDLRVIDVSTPSTPTQITSLNLGGSPKAIEIAGNYAYVVSTGSNDLKVIDIRNPTNPVILLTTPAGQAGHIEISGNYAYVANTNLNVFELSCPFSLTIDPVSGEMTAASTIELPNALGDHTATMDLDMANFSIVNGASRLMVADNGEIGIGTTEPQATLDLHGADDNTRGRIISRRGSRNSYIAMAGPGNSPYHSTVEVAQLNTGTVETAIAISNQDNASFGYVGIGRVPTTNRLEVRGQASKNMAGDWLANSDARLKKNIQQLDADAILKKLLALKGVTYEWNDNKTTYERPAGIQYGFTAQNIQEVFPTLVEEDAEGYLQTAYGTYDAMYVEAFRAQQKQIEAQRQQIATQQKLLRDLQQKTTLLAAENQQLQQQVTRIQEVEATLAALQQQLSSPDHSTTTKK